MANIFTRKNSREITTSPTKIGSYSVGASTIATVIGLSVANKTANTVTANVYLSDNTNAVTGNTYIAYNTTIVAGGTLIVAGGDQKLVLIPGDSIVVQSTGNVDANMNVLEIS